MVVFSFNESRLVTVWGGFSTKWYGELMRNEQVLGAAWLSFKIAAMNATGATVLGTITGLALARFGRFRGRPLLTGLATAPLVMPEVITGLSLLLLFVAMEQLIGWPAGRGITTITIAHMTFSMAYVTVVVQSRLATLDESLEEAAMDLGARPAKVFFLITMPIILPAICARLAARVHAFLGRPRDHELRDRPGLEHAAGRHLLEDAPRRQPGHQRARDHPGARGRDVHGGLRHLDAAPAEAARAGHAARRRHQRVMPASKLPGVGTTIFTVMSRLAAETGAINLGQGFPDFDPPARLRELVAHHLGAGHNQYAPMAGLPRCARRSPRLRRAGTAGASIPPPRSPSPPAAPRRSSPRSTPSCARARR